MEKLIIEMSREGRKGYTLPKLDVEEIPIDSAIPESKLRKLSLNLPEVSENEVVRHFTRLSLLNYNIDKGLYPLGSCTMKYNPKVNEKTASLNGFAALHPLVGDDLSQGALKLMYELSEQLTEIAGMDACTLQPCAGAHGELTGVKLIRAYHLARKDEKRIKMLIPTAAHGTNPASAHFAGFEIVNIKSTEDGRVDLEDLAAHCGDDVAGFMLTNPNTVGLFEKNIVQIEKMIHGCGGLMYMDGANLNALMGIVRPGDMGFDVMHINLHKTFSTPHGGGGPGAGPVVCKNMLKEFLPVPRILKEGDKYSLEMNSDSSIGRVHAFFGNFGVLVRAYTYIKMLGAKGIREVSENAIINANYILSKIKDYYDVPYPVGQMHEIILCGDRQHHQGSSTKDIAKRLLDYGFHAPTIYFPVIVHEAMLIEPTETETKESLDAFSDAMIAIAKEIIENPALVNGAPYNTPVKRMDEGLAARKLDVSWNN